MIHRNSTWSSSTEDDRRITTRSLFDWIFLNVLVWVIPLILASVLLSGSLPGKRISSAEDTFVYGIKKRLSDAK